MSEKEKNGWKSTEMKETFQNGWIHLEYVYILI